MTQRVFNFSPGPAVLPEPVLAEVQRDFMALPGVGASILEISHRSKAFEDILKQAEINLRQLLKIPDDYAVLFLQGGARLQFSMIPMNLAGEGRPVVRLSRHRLLEQVRGSGSGEVWRAPTTWDGKATNYDRLPATRRFEARSASGICLLRIERNDSRRAVRHRAGRRQTCRSCAMRRAIFSAGRSTSQVRHSLRLRSKERRPGRRHGCRSFARTCSSEAAIHCPATSISRCTSRKARCGTRRRPSRFTS